MPGVGTIVSIIKQYSSRVTGKIMPARSILAPKNCCKIALALTCLLGTSGLWQQCGAERVKATKLKDEQLQGEALLDRAEKLGSKYKPDKAMVLIERFLKDHPNDSRALRLQGDCYFYADMEGKEHYKARECYDRAIKYDPQNSVAYRMIAELYMVDGKYDQAVLYAGQALACKHPTEFAYPQEQLLTIICTATTMHLKIWIIFCPNIVALATPKPNGK